jgi:hypothetical protein
MDLLETSQQPISQTTCWLKVTPYCNHCNHFSSSHAVASTFKVCARKRLKRLTSTMVTFG